LRLFTRTFLAFQKERDSLSCNPLHDSVSKRQVAGKRQVTWEMQSTLNWNDRHQPGHRRMPGMQTGPCAICREMLASNIFA